MSTDRVLEAARAFVQSTGVAPHWCWFVPGRIEIFGKHTDYAGGRSLLCAVPRGFGVAAGPRDDDVVRVVASPGWEKYVSVVARRLSTDFPGARLGADIALASDLPRAAGLSSSSALVVALALVLIERGNLDSRPEWRQALPTLHDLAGYLGAVENGLPFSAFSGGAGVGTLGGSEDHTAILLCRPEHVSAYSYLPVRHHGDAHLPEDWRFVVMSSGVEADKAGAAREQYNRASHATQTLCDLWRRHFGAGHGVPHLAAALATNPDAIPEFAAALRSKEHDGLTGVQLVQRLKHFVAEDARVPAALEAVRRGDRAALGELARASQHDAEQLLGNQIPETIELVELARSVGAFAASSFGAGFGGSVWALIDAAEAGAFENRWKAAYLARFPSHLASSFVCRPVPAAMPIRLK